MCAGRIVFDFGQKDDCMVAQWWSSRNSKLFGSSNPRLGILAFFEVSRHV